ncbi:hypothetical protein D3C85_1382850 [compost metagenome]
MRHGRVHTTPAPCAKRQAKLAIQRQRARRHPEHTSHIHERVIGLVQVCLSAPALNVVAELDAAEPKGIAELLRRDVGAVAMVNTYARRIGFPPVGRCIL